jgi:hypothetical protein
MTPATAGANGNVMAAKNGARSAQAKGRAVNKQSAISYPKKHKGRIEFRAIRPL